MMVTLINKTNKCIRCCSRLNGRWFDGIFPGQVLECDEPYKVQALLKHGCEILTPKVKLVEDVVKEYVETKKKKNKKKEVV